MQHLFTCLFPFLICRAGIGPSFGTTPLDSHALLQGSQGSVTGAESWRNSEHLYIACSPIIDSIYSGSDADMDADTDARRHRDRRGESGRAS